MRKKVGHAIAPGQVWQRGSDAITIVGPLHHTVPGTILWLVRPDAARAAIMSEGYIWTHYGLHANGQSKLVDGSGANSESR